MTARLFLQPGRFHQETLKMTLIDRLDREPFVLLDGATGTELEHRGFPLEAAGWSARAIDESSDLLAAIHRDYAEAGADIVTANTFRLHGRNVSAWTAPENAQRLVRRTIEIARGAVPKTCLIGASLAPIGDCYSPEEVPSEQALEAEHAELANRIAEAGADLILVETMVAIREAVAASRAAKATGLPYFVSFVSGPQAQLLSGETLRDGVRHVLEIGPAAVCVNCVSVSHVDSALDVLAEECGNTPFGVYANTGERGPDGVWRVTNAAEPAVYAVAAKAWQSRGATILGGCCGTTPGHVQALKSLAGK